DYYCCSYSTSNNWVF
nr:immunoglobulin light chain junction region [Macaca mulatta]